MSNSSLVNYVAISPNSNPRKNKIKKITIHHMAGNLSVETCGNVFSSGRRQASANYGIGSDGRVGMYVEEKNRAWTSSSPSNDHQAITIEVANDGGANTNWHVSDTALAKLIDLCVDICKRNGIASLNYTGNANGNLTRHNMFKNTTCPGPYLQSKFPYIAEEVNKRLRDNVTPTPAPNPSSGGYSGNSIVDYLNSIGVDSSYAHRSQLASINGISNYRGTAEQNIKLLNILRNGNTPKPAPATNTQYLYANYNGASISDALKSIGVDNSYAYRAKLAQANGISNYTGTAAQNTELLYLLKKGKLIKA